MKIFEVDVHYIQQICYTTTYNIEAEDQHEACEKVEEIIEGDEYLDEGLDAEGFKETHHTSLGPDIGDIRLDGVVLTDQEVA